MSQRPHSDWTKTPARAAAAIALVSLCTLLCLWSLAGGYAPTRAPLSRDQAGQPASSLNAADNAPSLSAAVLIDLNTANQAQLESLPGIGPAMAERIIADRAEQGPFNSVDELDRVKGIGPRTIERLRGRVRAAGPARE